MRAHSTACLVLILWGIVQPGSGWEGSAANCESVVITKQPQSQTVLENCPATFSVGVTGTGPLDYQWYRDEQPVPGATNSSYTIPHVFVSDSGMRVHATIANACSQAISSEATVTILLDVVPPRLLRARGDASLERVIVTFAVGGGCGGYPGLDVSTAEDPYSYSFSGGILASDAKLETNGTTVILTTSPQVPNSLYTLTVEGVTDRTGNVISPGSETKFQSWVVVPGPEPTVVPPPINLFRTGPDLWLTWPYGSFLQSAGDPAGPWQTLSDAEFPYRVTPDGFAQFYRAFFDP